MDKNQKHYEDKFEMKREVHLTGAACTVIGIIVGAGIFIAPGKMLPSIAGNGGVAILIWLFTGCMCMCSSLCYCELGTCIRESGTDYAYFHAAYGPLAAFLYQWVKSIYQCCISSGTRLVMFVIYILEFFQQIGFCSTNEYELTKLFGILLLMTITYLQCTSVKRSVYAEIIFTSIKVFSIAAVVLIGFVYLAKDPSVATKTFRDSFSQTNLAKINFLGTIQAIYFCSFAYGGWDKPGSVSEEVVDAAKTLPKAIIIGMSIVTLLYVTVNLAYLFVLTPTEMMESEGVVAAFIDQSIGVVGWLLPVIICMSLVGCANGSSFVESRILFAAARRGHMPKIFSMVHVKYYTPVPALIMQTTFAFMLFMIGNFDSLVMALEFITWTVSGFSAGSLLVLRWKHPDLHRPFKVPIAIPIFVAIISVILVLMGLIQHPSISIFYTIGYIALGLPVYYIFIYRQKSVPGMRKVTSFLQVLMRVAPTDRRIIQHFNDCSVSEQHKKSAN